MHPGLMLLFAALSAELPPPPPPPPAQPTPPAAPGPDNGPAAGIGTLGTLFIGLRGDALTNNTAAFAGALSIAAFGIASIIGGIVLMVMNNTQVHIEPFSGALPPAPPNAPGPATM